MPGMKVLFVASFSVITTDPAAARKLFLDDLQLPIKASEVDPNYMFTEQLEGAKHFGIWPLEQAAEAFSTKNWPADKSIPQASVEFEVADAAEVNKAAKELQAKGHQLLHEARTEPWGQTVARLLSAEGLIIGISYAPSFHEV
jgi:hypothetical protein